MKLDVVVYLLRDRPDAVDLARQHLETELGYGELPLRDDVQVDTTMVLFVKSHDERVPAWVDWCGELFQTAAAPKSISVGSVLLLVASGRTFAVTFGTGWNSLPRHLVEPEFGLRVAMQLVPPTKVQSLVTRSVDLKSNEKNIYNHAGSELAQFPLDAESEWLRQAGGGVDGLNGFAAVTGKTSIRLIGYTHDLSKLPATCSWLLGRFTAPVPEAFRFYENLQPLSPHDAQHQALEDALLAKIASQHFDGLTLVLDREDAERATERALKHGHSGVDLAQVADDEVWAAVRHLAAHARDYDPTRLTLVLKDADGKVSRDPLLRFVHAEIADATGVWIRMEGSWFRAAQDYVTQVQQMLRAEVPDLTARLRMPAWSTAAHRTELSYNTTTATRRRWLLQDQVNVTRHGQTIEPCDLLTADAEFIHLKNADSSQHVGAQIGQLRAAAYMLKGDEVFRRTMAMRYAGHTGANDLLDKRATFVLAMARQAHLDIYGNMLVAKINILDCGRKVRALGHDFAVCKVDRT
jgi:uncharacterized protein (TIGR04141 family)